jgi:membrane fusion protein (multidrug efflux system)
MAAPFSRSMRFLATDSPRVSRVALLVGTLLLGAWLTWFFGARVAVYVVSETARVEVGRVAYRVDAPVTGQVAAVHLALGRDVKAGDVLVELVNRDLQIALAEKRTRVAGLGAEIGPLKRQLATARGTLNNEGGVAGAQIGEAGAHNREAAAMARLAEEEARRSERLFEAGLVSAADVSRAKAQETARQALANASEQTIDRVKAEGRARENDLGGEVARLEKELAQLEGDKRNEETAINQIAYDLELRKIRAPATGRVGDIAVLQAGSILHQGDPIGFIVPGGGFRVVATFSAVSAIGHVRRGQAARLRLSGFPWQQFGTVSATVVSVASEGRDGHLRVELAIRQDPRSLIPFQHGLTGTVEVEVERVSPAVLVLRAAGSLVRGNTGT